MFHPDLQDQRPRSAPPTSAPALRTGCLVEGCTCKDARIVSPRRAAFFARIARLNGETADRVMPVEAAWSLPSPADA